MKPLNPSLGATIRNSHRRLIWPVVASSLVVLAYFGLETLVGHLAGLEVSHRYILQLEPALAVLGVLAGTWLASRFVQLLVTSVMLRKGKRPSRLLLQLIAIALFVLAAVTVLSSTFDGALTGALATSGILVAVIGFALRNVIADVFSGIALSIESPYRIGDWIETDTGIAGRVVEINWRATRIETRNQVHIVVPNGRMAVGRLTNYSSPRPYFRTQIPVTVDFEVPVARAKRILLAAVKATNGIRPTPAPDVKVDSYGERGMKYVVRYWLPGFADDTDCRDAVLANIDRYLRLAGLPVPYRERVLLERPRPAIRDAALDPVEALAHLPAFQSLPPETSSQLGSAISVLALAPEDILLDNARPDDRIYILVEGLLELRDDTDRDLRVLEPGTIVGQSARLVPTVTATGVRVIAATDSLVFSLPVSRLKTSLLESSPLGDVLRNGVRRWQALLDEHRHENPVDDPSAPSDRPMRSGSVLIRLRDWMK
jgi:small-conductance mechanosensitive channel